MTLKSNSEELATMAQEIGAELIRGREQHAPAKRALTLWTYGGG